MHAPLVKLQGGLERDVTFFELLHECFEFGDRRLEVLDRVIHAYPSLQAACALSRATDEEKHRAVFFRSSSQCVCHKRPAEAGHYDRLARPVNGSVRT